MEVTCAKPDRQRALERQHIGNLTCSIAGSESSVSLQLIFLFHILNPSRPPP